MNVLFIMGVYPGYGGVEIVSTVLANEFVKRGYDITIVSFKQKEKQILSLLDSRVSLLHLGCPIKSKSNQSILSQYIKEHNVNIIINQWCLNYKVTQLCRKAIGTSSCKLITVYHNTPDNNARIENVRLAMLHSTSLILKMKLKIIQFVSACSIRYVYSKVDKFIVLSDAFVAVFKDFTNLKNVRKLEVLNNPITISDMDFVYNPEIKNKEIIYIGRLEYNQKRTIRILQIWEKLYPKHLDWKLILVGDGNERSSLEDYIREKELKNVFLKGFQSPENYYKKGAIMLMTSEYEGVPLVIGEAKYFGVIPVVYGSYEASRDVIDNEIDGYVVGEKGKFNVDEFVYLLDQLITNPQKMQLMAQKAVDNSLKMLPENICDKWICIFNKLLRNKKIL